jgi:hypothetical protein
MKDIRRHKKPIGQSRQRRDEMWQERIHDPYKARAKHAGPALCSQCGAAWDAGRWFWASRPLPNAEKVLCPACHRVSDKYPASEIHVSGSFALAHLPEIIDLIRKCEAREAKQHPLARIASIETRENELYVTTTDLHLPRVIANALERAFKRQAEYHYDLEGYYARIKWSREAGAQF